MPETSTGTDAESAAPAKRAPRKRAAKKVAPAAVDTAAVAAPVVAAPVVEAPVVEAPVAEAPVAESAADTSEPAPRATRTRARKAAPAALATAPVAEAPVVEAPAAETVAEGAPEAPAKRAPRKRAAKKAAPAPEDVVAEAAEAAEDLPAAPVKATRRRRATAPVVEVETTVITDDAEAVAALIADAEINAELDVEDEETDIEDARAQDDQAALLPDVEADVESADAAEEADAEAEAEGSGSSSRRRRRGRRGRGGRSGRDADADADPNAEDSGAVEGALDGAVVAGESADAQNTDGADGDDEQDGEAAQDSEGSGTRRRRKRRRRGGNGTGGASNGSDDDPADTVVHVREPREAADEVRGIKGSTRLEAKRQRRRDSRDTGRRRTQILTEAEFLARRESVDRVMAVRQRDDRTQIAVLEDGILVEHYVTRATATSYVGNIYLGRVQNVLPSMEAAFIDIGKGRNGVLYAGEVDWEAAGLAGRSRAIEQAMSAGDPVLVQVSKDPVGHKGARLTSQISLPGRFLVYVPGGGMTGISRKLPDTERSRLKAILKKIVPEDAGVIIRTAAEGASEDELTRDVERLQAMWETVKAAAAKPSSAPTLLHGEPDLAIRVVRDVFNEDFAKLIVSGEGAWETVSEYVTSVAPELSDRISRYTGDGDLFHDLRIDEQLAKALDRKVWLPSGGSLVIDRTEAMTVVDVNTGKFTGSGGNLEQTVTRNNLEAAEEVVRQLRLRDIGGIVVIDFIDMVLESNRDLVMRRLTECLGRDRTKHQVAEVTSLGLVQMTRKRVGEGLLEAFSEPCEHCNGRGLIVRSEPITKHSHDATPDFDAPQGKSSKRRKRRDRSDSSPEPVAEAPALDPEARRKAAEAMQAIAGVVRDADEDSDRASVSVAAPAAEAPAEAAAAEPDEAARNGSRRRTSRGSSAQPSSAKAEAAAEAAAAPSVEVVVPAAATAAPRRRRAASRPAGPPVHA